MAPLIVILSGSSPLARGTRCGLPNYPSRVRLIPARAGNTVEEAEQVGGEAAHPRSRGEHILRVISLIAVLGSSPLARGTRRSSASTTRQSRLIPARAGNTCCRVQRRRPAAAHPRSRGEHRGRGYPPGPVCGSSPLARGTPHQGQGNRRRMRLIPARAGNTPVHRHLTSLVSAHPRSRGEHTC